jgi:hypothetical protein
MSCEKDVEMSRVNLQVQVEHVARLLDMSLLMASRVADARAAEAKLELVETLLWKHHRQLVQLQQAAKRVVDAL